MIIQHIFNLDELFIWNVECNQAISLISTNLYCKSCIEEIIYHNHVILASTA